MSIVDEFEWRGMLYDATDGTREMLERERVTAYVGFDPTASSLHVGSLLPIMALARLQRAGHTPIALVGGGTGLIGDPSGKSQERTLLSIEDVDANVQGMRAQLERFLDFDAAANPARLMNNADWLRPVTLLEFLRDTGKHFTVNYMLAKESVKRRLGGDEGISFTEFSYLLLQSYDYLVLHQQFGCTLQMGGSRPVGQHHRRVRSRSARSRGAKAHGLVLPLVVDVGGHEVRQDRSRHGVARPGAHVAVSLLPVLAEHRRSRRRELPEVLHLARSRGDRRARGDARPRRRRRARRSGRWRAK